MSSGDVFTNNNFLSTSTGPSHKPSLTVLINQTELDNLTNGDGTQAELPQVAPLSHELFMRDHYVQDEEEGDGQGWDVSDFLLSRRHMLLDEMRSELRTYLATLRTSLVAVINSEYEAFIGLSLGLRHANVSASLASIRRPVLPIRNSVNTIRAELYSMKEEMENVLDERKRTRETNQMLKRLLVAEEQVGKVEGLLKIGEAKEEGTEVEKGATSEDSRADSPSKRLERISAEYNQMLYLLTKAGELPFIKSLDPRVSLITTTLHNSLSDLLSSTLLQPSASPRESPRDSLLTLLRTYTSLGLYERAEETFRKTVVRPFVEKTIHRDALLPPTGPLSPPSSEKTEEEATSGLAPAITLNDEDSRGGKIPTFYLIEPITMGEIVGGIASNEDMLIRLYNKILNFISKECGNFLDVAERILSSNQTSSLLSNGGSTTKLNEPEEVKKKAGFDILADVIFDEVATRLTGELGTTIFVAGQPAQFHHNYILTSIFISRIENLCPTLPSLLSLRSHPSYVNFLKRFQLPVYFQLRFKEVVTMTERSLNSESITTSSTGAQLFLLAESETIWKAVNFCWREEVYLDELGGRFWRLTLQLLSRYRTWLNSVVPRYVMPASSSSTNLSAMAAGTANNSQRSSFEGQRDRLGTPSANSRPSTPSGGGEQSEDATLRQLTVLIADSTLMAKKIQTLFEEAIERKLPESEEGETSPSLILQASLSEITSIVPSLSSQIISILSKRCSEHLKHVRAVASQVRVSTRKGASEPSFFVGNILKELKAYMLTGPGKVVDEEMKMSWSRAVVDEVANRYANILVTQKKQEDSLRWLKKGRQGLSFFSRGTSTPTEESGASDNDKVTQQMQLDIQFLGEDAKTLGVDVEGSKAWEELKNATLVVDDEKK